jgi:Pyruvate/2-oxoacid:ferredoxin oxidoreductase delta subunit
VDLIAGPGLLKGESLDGSGWRGFTAFYFSGTGNSYRLAVWAAQAASSRGIPGRIVPVRDVTRSGDFIPGPQEFVGLFTPTHGFTAPWPSIRFALQAPRGRGATAVVIASRAALKFGRVFVPGLDGTAAYLPALILALKGYRVRGVIGIDMPSNWMAVHSGLKPANVMAIVARARAKAGRFIGRILEGRVFFGSWASFPAGLLLAPVSLGYLLYGRFGLAKLFFASNRCNGCGLCARRCPEQAVRMYQSPWRAGARQAGDGNQLSIASSTLRPYWTWRCESCMRCMAFCPREAVEVSHSLSVIMGVLTTICPSILVVLLLGKRIPPAVLAVASYATYLAVTFSLYAVFAAAIRIPAVNTVFKWTTFTPLFRRYHEPDTNVNEMNPHGADRS